MNQLGKLLPSVVVQISLAAAASLALLSTATLSARSQPTITSVVALRGRVVTADDIGLPSYNVSLYASVLGDQTSSWQLLGSTTTDSNGAFQINYVPPNGSPLFVEAEHGSAMLVSAIGLSPGAPGNVVVNERTTVATGNAFAQFVSGRTIVGNKYGMINAVSMAGNLADPQTGEVAQVLASLPNGTQTSTLDTFNSLTNVVASCVANESKCTSLFDATTPAGGSRPTTVLEAISNLVKYPSYPGYPTNSYDPIFLLSRSDSAYTPALSRRPTSWLLFLKFTGGFYSVQDSDNLMNGPGNSAVDEKGYVWVNDNYVPEPQGHFACAGRRLIKFYPSGQNFPGSPYFGGGLSGAGYGITLDPNGIVWVGNFGFQDPPCPHPPLNDPATTNSVSAFAPNGQAISPDTGFTQGGISWPQATISDRQGNIWVANCGNDSVTKIPHGDPTKAFNVLLGAPPTPGNPQMRPFGAALDLQGNLWVADNRSETLSVVDPNGTVLDTLPTTDGGTTELRHPMGVTADIQGNIWVANSDWVDVPCPGSAGFFGPATNPSIALYQAQTRKPYPGSPFTGGGLTLPWGITVDGNDTVWVFNFGVIAPKFAPHAIYPPRPPTGISRFCGLDTSKCPPGMKVGDPISPSTGYRSNAIERITGGQIDPSGNIWMVNNWKRNVHPLRNPGGNAVVVAVGAAAPIKTPLIGPPIPFSQCAPNCPPSLN